MDKYVLYIRAMWSFLLSETIPKSTKQHQYKNIAVENTIKW